MLPEERHGSVAILQDNSTRTGESFAGDHGGAASAADIHNKAPTEDLRSIKSTIRFRGVIAFSLLIHAEKQAGTRKGKRNPRVFGRG